MNYIFKKIKLSLFILLTLFLNEIALAKENNLKYQKKDVANYLSGLVTLKKNDFEKSFEYLKKIKNLKGKHYNYNAQFIRSLILLNKFEEAFTFANDIWKEDELLFEADLLLTIKYFLKEDYEGAQKYLNRVNKISKSNLLFEDFFGNIFLSWIEAIKKKQENSFRVVNNIPDRFDTLKKVQIAFLNSYFETEKVKTTYKQVIENKNYSFPRYNFFLANYLITKNESINSGFFNNIKNDLDSDHLLIKELKGFIKTKQKNKISNFFNHKKPTDALAEIFYIMANLYSTEQDYKSSNFYLNISLFLNNDFVPNKTLLAENYFFLKKYKKSKKIYNEIKKIGPTYSWHASKNISIILARKDNKKSAILSLEKDFKLIFNPSSEIHYEMGNFYKKNEIYEKAIKHYTTALKNLKENHYLFPEILKMRATCYERAGKWDKAEKDFLKSLKLDPDQPYTLNYLAYSWIEKKINIAKALNMLKKATIETEDDPYIIDSLGWAYYNLKNFKEAKKYLQRAVELLPLDPTVNDHYADSLWQLDKKIQAVYFWQHVLLLDGVEEKVRDNIDKKIIFGINNNL
jgi:tetratricopeptide (TPR) repeat protein